MRHIKRFCFAIELCSGEQMHVNGQVLDEGTVREEMMAVLESTLARLPDILESIEEEDRQTQREMN